MKNEGAAHGEARVALITGGASGIGRATALAFAADGYRVMATAFDGGQLAQCQADEAFNDITVLPLDVTNDASVEALFRAITTLDVLVNAAGVSRVTDEFTPSGFHLILDTNLSGTMRCCYAARVLLKQRGGSIVNVASTMSFLGSGTAPAYAAGKGAIAQFTKSLAIAWAPDAIRCNAVAPGWIDTPMTRSLQSNTERYERVLARTPMKRLGTAAEVAQAVLFIASPRASFINGAVLPVDGGYLIHGL